MNVNINRVLVLPIGELKSESDMICQCDDIINLAALEIEEEHLENRAKHMSSHR
jgi:hypothetical protein